MNTEAKPFFPLKGNEKKIIRNRVLPSVLYKHILNQGRRDNFLDIGVDNGFVSQKIRTFFDTSFAVEPATIADQGKIKDFTYVINTTWQDWFENATPVFFDFILASHSLYYLGDVSNAIEQITSRLKPKGTACFILEDEHSGKINLLKSLGETVDFIPLEVIVRELEKRNLKVSNELITIDIVFDDIKQIFEAFNNFLGRDPTREDDDLRKYIGSYIKPITHGFKWMRNNIVIVASN